MSPKKVWTDDKFNLYVEFKDGKIKKINIKTFLASDNADSKKVKSDLNVFKKVFLEDGYAISWPNLNVSLDPESIYEEGENATKEQSAAKYREKVNKHYKKG